MGAGSIGSSSILHGFGDGPLLDASARLRVSQPVNLFDSTLQYDNGRLVWDETITDTSGNADAAHDADSSSVDLIVEAQDTVTRQSRRYIRYQPGKSQFVLCTFCMAPGATNLTQAVGLFDGSNGIFLALTNTTLSVNRRTSTSGSPVDESVSQSSWNVDPMDGTGPSGLTLDITKTQIFMIDLEWLGVGRVRVGFVIDGVPYVVHEFTHANSLTLPYVTTANLPVRYTAVGSAGLVGQHAFKQICCMVASEGGDNEERGFPFAAGNGGTTIAVTTRRPVFSIRPAATFNSIVNRAEILPYLVEVYSGDQALYWELVLGGALTGAAFAAVDGASAVQKDVAATVITGGVTIQAGYVASGGTGASRRPGATRSAITDRAAVLALDIAGNHPTSPYSDVLSIVGTSVPGASTDTAATLSWREVR